MIIREVGERDLAAACQLVRDLAAGLDEESPITEGFAAEYFATAGSGGLVAEEAGRILGLISYTIRPNLYHASQTCLVEELVVDSSARGRGIGGALLTELINRMHAIGCAEISVTVVPDNVSAQRFYRAHGLVDVAVFLEKHF